MAILTEEQVMLRDAARVWVGENWPVRAGRNTRYRELPPYYDPAMYANMSDMGWTGMLIPECYGGSAMGHVGMGIVLEEFGRHLVPSPFLTSAVGAASALLLGGSDEQRQQYLPHVVTGKMIGTLAAGEARADEPLRASRSGQGWQLDGIKQPVFFGAAADFIIVDAQMPLAGGGNEAIELFLVSTAATGITRHPLCHIDGQSAVAYHFERVVVGDDASLNSFEKGERLRERVLDHVRAGLAAEMLGTATQAFEMTLEYLKTRRQFDQAIGSFQALQHRAAEMHNELELARSTVEGALDALDALDVDSSQIPQLVSLAKATAGETLRLVCNEMIQLHGGIAMTEEHDAGLYLKRARVLETIYGNCAFHRERFGRSSGY